MSTVQPTPQPAFAGRQTRQNLRCAARGKMQAQRTYLDCARRLEEQSLHVIAHAFRFTAAQEKEHAAVLNGLLALHGEAVPGDDAPPLPLPPEPAGMLIAAAKYEHEGWDSFYPQCADIAREDGYPRIAAVFRLIAEKEHEHARRFLQYAKALSEGTLFRDQASVSWFCLPCGQVHTGREAPLVCSYCGRDQGHFIRSSYHPFAVEG